ncbi:hypothetical protein M5689_022577 [Euphorbia peplus]|nr:hypothetical protein M5689_022577 [Euphorbia peplus]
MSRSGKSHEKEEVVYTYNEDSDRVAQYDKYGNITGYIEQFSDSDDGGDAPMEKIDHNNGTKKAGLNKNVKAKSKTAPASKSKATSAPPRRKS